MLSPRRMDRYVDQIDDVQLGRELAQGKRARVFEGRIGVKRLDCAVKILKDGEQPQSSQVGSGNCSRICVSWKVNSCQLFYLPEQFNELERLAKFHSPHIVDLLGFDTNGNCPGLYLGLMEGNVMDKLEQSIKVKPPCCYI